MLTNKYAILIYINLPLILFGIFSAIVDYKASPPRISHSRCVARVTFWILVGVLLAFVGPLYDLLLQTGLTNSPSMSIFDVVLLTMVLFCFVFLKHAHERFTYLNKKVARLHENIVIYEAEHKR